jgi:flagellar hook-length control protein FliK
MAELLSMTLLSPESVSVAKPQAALSNEDLTESEQSFAATLAAEVSGQAPEKPAKATAKARQNAASDTTNSKEPATGIDAAGTENKAVASVAHPQSEPNDEELLVVVESDPVLQPIEASDQSEGDQSHWLNLLEKAKSLHNRLAQAEKATTDTKVTPGPRVDKIGPGARDDVAEVQVVAEQQSGKLSTTDILTSEFAGAGKTKSEGAIPLSEKLVAGKNTEEPLTEEEQKALKLMPDADKMVKNTNTAADTSLKQIATEQKSVDTAEKPKVQEDNVTADKVTQQGLTAQKVAVDTTRHVAAEQPVSVDKALKQAVTELKISVDTPLKQQVSEQKVESGSEQKPTDMLTDTAAEQTGVQTQKELSSELSKVSAPVEKSLNASPKPVQREAQQSETEAEVVEPALILTSKTPLQAESQLQPKVSVAAANAGNTENTENTETEITVEESPTPQTAITEPKVSVQAQSAAAVIAPVVQQTKTSTADTKVTTEDVLKQIQSATVATAGKQGSSSSSGDSAHQGSAETLLSTIEQQKASAAVTTQTNSFSSELKSSLEKAGSGITLTGREAVSEQSQKQVDQLGQKLNLIQPEASNQLKEKMLMMVKDKVHTAEIRLDPSELGSMQIKISLQQDQMSVQFMVQQGNAKELMEQQMPKLKELLQQQGIELSQGSVQQQQQSSAGQEGGRRTAGGNTAGVAQGSSDDLPEAPVVPTKNSDRVVDYYA